MDPMILLLNTEFLSFLHGNCILVAFFGLARRQQCENLQLQLKWQHFKTRKVKLLLKLSEAKKL